MPVERAGGGVVADDPRLVVAPAVEAQGANGVLPGQTARGATDGDSGADDPARGGVEGESGDQPGAVCRVVGDRRVGDAGEGTTLVDGDARNGAVLPVRPSVGGGGPAESGRAAAEEPAVLGDGDDGVAERERVGFDDSGVLAGGVGERICVDPRQAGRRRGCAAELDIVVQGERRVAGKVVVMADQAEGVAVARGDRGGPLLPALAAGAGPRQHGRGGAGGVVPQCRRGPVVRQGVRAADVVPEGELCLSRGRVEGLGDGGIAAGGAGSADPGGVRTAVRAGADHGGRAGGRPAGQGSGLEAAVGHGGRGRRGEEEGREAHGGGRGEREQPACTQGRKKGHAEILCARRTGDGRDTGQTTPNETAPLGRPAQPFRSTQTGRTSKYCGGSRRAAPPRPHTHPPRAGGWSWRPAQPDASADGPP